MGLQRVRHNWVPEHTLRYNWHITFCHFILLVISFAVQSFLFWWVSFVWFSFVAYSLNIISRLSSTWPMSRSFLPMFSCGSFIVSGLTFTSLIHFKLLFMRDVRSSFILICECLIFPAPFIDEAILFPLSILGSFCQLWANIPMRGFIS